MSGCLPSSKSSLRMSSTGPCLCLKASFDRKSSHAIARGDAAWHVSDCLKVTQLTRFQSSSDPFQSHLHSLSAATCPRSQRTGTFRIVVCGFSLSPTHCCSEQKQGAMISIVWGYLLRSRATYCLRLPFGQCLSLRFS